MLLKKIRIAQKLLKLMVLLFLLLLFIPYSTYNAKAVTYPNTWGEAQELSKIWGSDAAAVYFSFNLVYRDKHLERDQMEYSNVLKNVCIYVMGYTSNMSLTKVIFTSPSGNNYPFYLYEISLPSVFPAYYRAYITTGYNDRILTFNEEGTWIVELQSNISNIMFFESDILTLNFDNNSKITDLHGRLKGIEVIPPSVTQLIRSANANEDLVKSYRSVQYSKREKRRESIKNIILRVIEKGIDEFKNLDHQIQRIKQGELVGLPKYIYLSDTHSILNGAAWGDFAREDEELFKNIEKYLEKKAEYLKTRNNCRELIKEHLAKNDALMDEITATLNQQKGDTSTSKQKILGEIADSILEKSGRGSYGKKFYEKFEDKFLKIRDEENIGRKIAALVTIAKELEEYKRLEKDLRKNKSKLQKKYCISNSELDELREKIKKELYDY